MDETAKNKIRRRRNCEYIWEKWMCLCLPVWGCSQRERVVGVERELKEEERGCFYTPTVKLGRAVTHTALQLPFEPSGSWEKSRKLSDRSQWGESWELQVTRNKNPAALPTSNMVLFIPLMFFWGWQESHLSTYCETQGDCSQRSSLA